DRVGVRVDVLGRVQRLAQEAQGAAPVAGVERVADLRALGAQAGRGGGQHGVVGGRWGGGRLGDGGGCGRAGGGGGRGGGEGLGRVGVEALAHQLLLGDLLVEGDLEGEGGFPGAGGEPQDEEPGGRAAKGGGGSVHRFPPGEK